MLKFKQKGKGIFGKRRNKTPAAHFLRRYAGELIVSLFYHCMKMEV
ncbi:hypothetical protein OROHE_015718 [Orobanche hederae]